MKRFLAILLLSLPLAIQAASSNIGVFKGGLNLGGQTNIISDNGTAMTFNGVVIGGGGSGGNWIAENGTNDSRLPGTGYANAVVATNSIAGNTYIWNQPGFNNGTFTNLIPGSSTNMFGFALPYDTDLGGLNIGGYGVGDVPRVLIGAASGDTNLTGQAGIHFLVFEQFPGGNADAYLGRTMFGFDNDFTHDSTGRWAFQLFESHGGYTGGFPDSVAFAGVNTGVTPDAGKPYAILHALNPTTLNDDLPKTNIVSLFEGRADQVGDLTQWKLTGGSTLLSIPKSGGIASFATDTAVPIAVTGWTNTFGKNAVVYVNGTAATYTIQNNASTLVRTNSIAVGNTSTAILQPNGKLVITGGSAISGSAVPF